MEPLHDDELRNLLKQWDVPGAPPALRERVQAKTRERVHEKTRGAWWSWWLKGSFRVPVPLGMAAAALLIVLGYAAVLRRGPERPALPEVNLTTFQPVDRLELRIVRSVYER